MDSVTLGRRPAWRWREVQGPTLPPPALYPSVKITISMKEALSNGACQIGSGRNGSEHSRREPPSVGSHALTVPCVRTKDAEGGRFRFRKGLGSGTLQASHQITR